MVSATTSILRDNYLKESGIHHGTATSKYNSVVKEYVEHGLVRGYTEEFTNFVEQQTKGFDKIYKIIFN